MDQKSGKPLRVFNPLSIWTDFALKSSGAMLSAAQAAVARKPKVAVIPDVDAPAKKAKPRKARKTAASRAKRRGR